ncbi:MAG TPA: YaeQ family protein [Polyangiaceae bacterium]|nr:YaeQ family protein [Polyangiaceae bacterium]
MALTATMYHFQITLSDVDRGVYEALDLRVARHPSETMRYLVTRTLAYCLSYEEGIAFSKGGLSSVEEAPVSIRDATGVLRAWIDVGSPSAERLHKASKAAERVALFTHVELSLLLREASARPIHQLERILVYRFEPEFLDTLDRRLDKNSKFEVVRTEGQLYVTIGGETLNGTLSECSLVPSA